MRLLFLSLVDFYSFDERNIYTDLLRQFIRKGHEVYCISPVERRTDIHTHLTGNGRILKLRIGNIQKTNFIEKGISTLQVERKFISGIKKYFPKIKFDVVLYVTPPITFASVIKYLKQRDNATTYLMLKDIFPQNAVDIGLMSTGGLKGILYHYFRKKEKQMYALSDRIGCMSPGNAEFLLRNNPWITANKIEVCPNCIEVCDVRLSPSVRIQMRDWYGIPRDKTVLVYGGNLGKPQDVPYIINCLRECSDVEDVYFLIAGSGTERHLLEEYVRLEAPPNVRLLEEMPKADYDRMIACCDIGLIFLDHRFTVPNFPSRLLSYMQAGLPVLAATDASTDIGQVIEDGGFGWWIESNSCKTFRERVEYIKSVNHSQWQQMSDHAFAYLQQRYSSGETYKTIVAAGIQGGNE